jgi:hypothetical protein
MEEAKENILLDMDWPTAVSRLPTIILAQGYLRIPLMKYLKNQRAQNVFEYMQVS